MERVKKRDAVLRAGTTVGFLSLPPLLAPRQETPRLGARVTHFEARKPRFRGAKTWRHPPLRGVENSLRCVENLSKGGVPLGCPPIRGFFSSNFRQEKIVCRIFRAPKRVFRRSYPLSTFSTEKRICQIFRAPKRVFRAIFRAFFVAFFAPCLAAPRPPPAVPPLGLGLLPSPEGAVRGPNPSAPGGPS